VRRIINFGSHFNIDGLGSGGRGGNRCGKGKPYSTIQKKCIPTEAQNSNSNIPFRSIGK